uniref:transposase n=1 Tax=Sulfitobacter mediterraneus TaxID=83219 RepID=UPI002168EABB|nr:transposase [Sulfitobacter mediterraneus]
MHIAILQIQTSTKKLCLLRHCGILQPFGKAHIEVPRADCAIKDKCTTNKERRVRRWEKEDVLERVQEKFDADPAQLAVRSMTVEHPYGTIKSWMGATHFKMRTLKKVATEMALHVLAYNMTRVMNIMGVPAWIAAMKA